MILKFNFKEEHKHILEKMSQNRSKKEKEIDEEMQLKINDNLSLHSNSEFSEDEIAESDILKIISSVKLEKVALSQHMIWIGDLIIRSVDYIYSILKEKGEETNSFNAKKFLLNYSDKKKEITFIIDAWIKNRDSWIKEGKRYEFSEEETTENLGIPKLGPMFMVDVMSEVFARINKDYPGEKIQISTPIDRNIH